ncbi:MAG: hypothetical protein ACJ8AG_19475 [Ktedonobacteraceae bacterium]
MQADHPEGHQTCSHPQPKGQRWATFLHNHAAEIWACDFLQVSDLFFRPLFAFFNTLAQETTGDPRRRYSIPLRSLGGATPTGSHRRMGKHRSI